MPNYNVLKKMLVHILGISGFYFNIAVAFYISQANVTTENDQLRDNCEDLSSSSTDGSEEEVLRSEVMVEKPTVSRSGVEDEQNYEWRRRLLLERIFILYDRLDRNVQFLTDLLRMNDFAVDGYVPPKEFIDTVEELRRQKLPLMKMISMANQTYHLAEWKHHHDRNNTRENITNNSNNIPDDGSAGDTRTLSNNK